MPEPFTIRYFLSDNLHPLGPAAELWHAPMPVSRNRAASSDGRPPRAPIRYGTYFQAIEGFLKRHHDFHLARAASALLQRTVFPKELRACDVFLEKHGACYHPSRLVLPVKKKPVSLVLNVAAGPAGKAVLMREVACLGRLAQKAMGDWLPVVYAVDRIPTRDSSLDMFLAPWFEGYHEFHLSAGRTDAAKRLRLWDPANGDRWLGVDQARTVFEKAATILTAYYDIETTEQIFDWQHAAGDFIVNCDAGVAVKLISVRRYTRLFKRPPGDDGAVFQALLMFLLNLSFKMRIDRIDGIGALGWLGEEAVEGMLDGFYKGLDRQVAADRLCPEMPTAFHRYLRCLSGVDLRDIMGAMVDRMPPHTAERSLVEKHFRRHAVELKKAIERTSGRG